MPRPSPTTRQIARLRRCSSPAPAVSPERACQDCQPAECPCLRDSAAVLFQAGPFERTLEPHPPLTQRAARGPKAPQRPRDTQPARGIPVSRLVPIQGGPQVVLVVPQAVQPEDLVRPRQQRLRRLGQAQEVGGVAAGEAGPLVFRQL